MTEGLKMKTHCIGFQGYAENIAGRFSMITSNIHSSPSLRSSIIVLFGYITVVSRNLQLPDKGIELPPLWTQYVGYSHT